MDEKVSVVIPTYNRSSTIVRAVNSVLNQSYKNIEVIVVDDGSTDETKSKLKAFEKDSRVKCIYHETNRGACAARNTGIMNVHSPYIAFLDSDDEWLPDKVEEQMLFLKEQNVDITFCSVLRIEKNKESIYPDSLKSGDLHKQFLRGNFISTGMLLGKTECFQILFDEDLPRLQDWDMAIRLSEKYKLVHQHIPLAEYYIQSDSISMNHEKLYDASLKVFKKYEDQFFADPIAYANICEQIAVAMIMTGRKGATQWLKKARKCRKTKKNSMMYYGCLLHMQEIMRIYECRKLEKRCK